MRCRTKKLFKEKLCSKTLKKKTLKEKQKQWSHGVDRTTGSLNAGREP